MSLSPLTLNSRLTLSIVELELELQTELKGLRQQVRGKYQMMHTDQSESCIYYHLLDWKNSTLELSVG